MSSQTTKKRINICNDGMSLMTVGILSICVCVGLIVYLVYLSGKIASNNFENVSYSADDVVVNGNLKINGNLDVANNFYTDKINLQEAIIASPYTTTLSAIYALQCLICKYEPSRCSGSCVLN